MRVARWSFGLLLSVIWISPASAVLCNNPDNLCVGDPCIIGSATVETMCTVDFGARDLVIQGVIIVPDGGVLSLEAKSVQLNGRIQGRNPIGPAVTLTATVGDVNLHGEIEVSGFASAGSITVDAGGNIDVKNRLNAKGLAGGASAGSVSLTADGTLATNNAAVIDAHGATAATVQLTGDAGVTIAGRVFADGAPGAMVQVTSGAGSVTLDKDIRIGGSGGTAVVSGATGVVLNDLIRANTHDAVGPNVTLGSSNGDVTLFVVSKVSGLDGGSLAISAPLGTVTPRGKLYARGKNNGGSITINAATINLTEDCDARGTKGDGGTIHLEATTLLNMDDGDADASGKGLGGTIQVLGGPASGNVTTDSCTLTATGGTGNGGQVTVSAPAGTVGLKGRVDVGSKGAAGGNVQIDGVAVSLNPKFSIYADNRTAGGEIRINQSGAGTLLMSGGTFDASEGGVIEALAPAGNLTVVGRLAVGPGCIGLSAGGTLDTSDASTDAPITPSCP